MDTRISSNMLCSAITAGLCSVGADVMQLGVVPTPAVAYLVKKYNYDAAVMITASHNPCEYNGIKIFQKDGFKLPDELEEKIEAIILDGVSIPPVKIGADGKFYADKTAVDGASTTGAAMIVYLGNEGETNTTYNHGLAIALSDANSGCNWSSGGDAGLTKYTSWCSETPAATDANTDMAGIANTAYLKGKGAAYEAATNADEYSVAGFTPATYGFSGWFLPSAGQWYKFFNGMCGLTWSQPDPGFGAASGSGSANFAAVNKAFGDAEYDTAKFGDDSNYWSSSEYAASNAVSVDFTSSHGGVIVDNGNKSTTTNRVRSFLAF